MKLFARITLVSALLLSLTVIVSALWKIGLGNNEAWAAVAAALAVLTSVISSWAAQRTVELQEDSQKPYHTLLSTYRADIFSFNCELLTSGEAQPMTRF